MSVLLDVEALMVEYPARRLAGCPSTVLNGVSVSVRAGECLGIVGAQGSGKTTFSNAVLGLVPVTSGSIRFRGEDIVGASHGRRRRLNEKIQAVFHDPYSSLHPSRTVEASLIEPLRAGHVPARAAARRVRELLRQVGLPVTASHRLPGELSDADRQRIALARALTLSPELIIFDDPVSALDAPARSALLELLMDLQETTGTAYLFISPDLAAVRLISHRTAVLERGEIAERGAGNRGLGDP